MESKLGLNFDLVEKARTSAANVAADVQGFIDQHTTVTVERAVCRLLGIDGVNEMDVPMPNVLVDHLLATSLLPAGAAWAIGNAMVETGKDPQGVAEAVDSGELDLSKLPAHSDSEIRAAITPVVNATVERINKNVAKRNAYLKEWGDKEGPYLYIIVATGNIYEDIIQAKAGAKQGADIIAVIRTTGQSLLDYVPYGATTEGFGGTYATQENFRLMRAALDEVGEEQHRYIRLCNYCSGLCMPEIAAMGALERLDVMLNDALYGILFRDINMQRTIVDQYFSRVINGYAGVIINTGEDNYLTTDDAITAAHTVLASQFLNEAFAKDAGMREEQMGLGHAFEMDPSVENTFLYELAQALVLCQLAAENLLVERLHHILLRAGLQPLEDPLGTRFRRAHHHHRVIRPELRPQRTEETDAVQHRHVAVEQDRARHLATAGVERLLPVLRFAHGEAVPLQDAARDLAHHAAVIHHEAGAVGHRILLYVPSSSSRSTSSRARSWSPWRCTPSENSRQDRSSVGGLGSRSSAFSESTSPTWSASRL